MTTSPLAARQCKVCSAVKPTSAFPKNGKTFRNECKPCHAANARFRDTGWTPAEYAAAMLRQNGRCAICNGAQVGGRFGRLFGDHCHRTGRPRELLCSNCNAAIGLLADSPDRLRAAADYITKHSPSS